MVVKSLVRNPLSVLTRCIAVGAACLFFAAGAQAGLIDFNSLTEGDIVTTQFSASHGVTFSADNVNTTVDHAVVFDSQEPDPTQDPDLRGPPGFGDWAFGNIKTEQLGNILIIQEVPGSGNPTTCTATECTPPDDEGRRPAGSIFIDFDFGITSFGFDLIDVEGAEEYTTDVVGPTSGFFAAFFTSGGTPIGTVGFGDFVTNDGNPYFDPTVVFGNRSANRISPISIAGLGGGFNTASYVEISLGGSGGIDNIVYTVPEPGTLAIFAFGLAGLVALRRRRKS